MVMENPEERYHFPIANGIADEKKIGRTAVQLFRIAALEYGNCRKAAYLNHRLDSAALKNGRWSGVRLTP